MGFDKLIKNRILLENIKKMGYEEPTMIQEKVLENFNSGKNIVGQSQTGTGKTAAFVLPLLQGVDSWQKKVQTLILTPTRELATQVREEIFTLSRDLFINSLAVYGQSSIFKQKQILNKGPQFVVGTPGRVCDLIDRGFLKLDNVRFFVLDEVDRMLDMGFIDDIDYVWSKMKNISQVMSFSATIPDELKNIITKYIGDDYVNIKATTEILVDKVDHSFIDVEKFRKYVILTKYLQTNPDAKVLIFSQTKHNTKDLAHNLRVDGFRVEALHGDLTQKHRFQGLNKFKNDQIQILVATDVAARGLNMNNVDWVINFDVPQDPESYIHRIGRTARAGKTGKAIMFVSRGEMKALCTIEKINKIKIKKINENGDVIAESASQGANGRRSNHFNRQGGNRGRGNKNFGGNKYRKAGNRGGKSSKFGSKSNKSGFKKKRSNNKNYSKAGKGSFSRSR